MLTKFIKFSLLLSVFIFNSCNVLIDNILDDDDKIEHGYFCDQTVLINSFSKTVNPCTYSITYTMQYELNQKGIFKLNFKNSKGSYYKTTKIIEINKGNHQVNVQIDDCNIKDELVGVCFMIYK